MEELNKKLKLIFNSNEAEISIPDSCDDLLKIFLAKFELSSNTFTKNLISLTYLDETDEECLINCDEDFKIFLELLEKHPTKNIIKGSINSEDSIKSIQSKENQELPLLNSSSNNLNSSESFIYNEISEMKEKVDDMIKKNFTDKNDEEKINELKSKLQQEKIELENKYKNELEEKEKYYKEELAKMENKIKQLSEENQKSHIQIQEFNKKLENLDEQKKNKEQKLIEEKQKLEKENKHLDELIKKKEEEYNKKLKEVELKCEKQIQETIESIESINTIKGNDDEKKSNEDLTKRIIEEINKNQNEMLLQIQKGQKNMEEEIKKLKQEKEKKNINKENIIKELKEKEIQIELENQKLREEIQNLKSLNFINEQNEISKKKQEEGLKKENTEKNKEKKLEKEESKNKIQSEIKDEINNKENSSILKSSIVKNPNNLDQKESTIFQSILENDINIATKQPKEFKSEINKFKNQYLEELDKKYKSIAIEKISEFMKNLGEEIKAENEYFLTNIMGKMEKFSSKKEINESLQLNKISENINDKISEKNFPISTIHKGIKCSNCDTEPIVGIRYKCPLCENFNLCEKCEKLENNNINPHQHNLIKMRKEEKKSKNLSKNVIEFKNGLKDNLNNDEKFISEDNNIYGKLNEEREKSIEKKSSFESEHNYKIEELEENYDIYEGTKFIEVSFKIENNSKSKYEKGKMKLKFDEKNSLLLPEKKCISINELKPGENQVIKIKYNKLEKFPARNCNNTYFSDFYIQYNGENITKNPQKINIRIFDKHEFGLIHKFREKYKIDEKTFSNNRIYQLLVDSGGNMQKAFNQFLFFKNIEKNK